MAYGRGRGHYTKRRYAALGIPLSPQEQAAKVVQAIRKGQAEGIPGWERIDRWTRDPVVAALAVALLEK